MQCKVIENVMGKPFQSEGLAEASLVRLDLWSSQVAACQAEGTIGQLSESRPVWGRTSVSPEGSERKRGQRAWLVPGLWILGIYWKWSLPFSGSFYCFFFFFKKNFTEVYLIYNIVSFSCTNNDSNFVINYTPSVVIIKYWLYSRAVQYILVAHLFYT